MTAVYNLVYFLGKTKHFSYFIFHFSINFQTEASYLCFCSQGIFDRGFSTYNN
jgi:hypothetical protein